MGTAVRKQRWRTRHARGTVLRGVRRNARDGITTCRTFAHAVAEAERATLEDAAVYQSPNCAARAPG